MTVNPSDVRVTGPLDPYAQGFIADLARRGYTLGTATGQLQLAAHLSRWMVRHEVLPDDLDGRRLAEFLEHRRAGGYVRRLSVRGLTPLLNHLRELQVVPEPKAPVAATQLEQLVEEFVRYLVNERGLATCTVHDLERVAVVFLSARAGSHGVDGIALGSLTTADVNAFVLDQSRRRSIASLGRVVYALRAFLRFLHLRGHTSVSLVAAVLAPACWKQGALSRAVDRSQVERLLGGTDRSTSTGRRDFAILVLLVRLGLRACEVARLTLDDVNWRDGAIRIAGKGNRVEELPLPVDVGEALADYCRHGRRQTACRSVLLHAQAPYLALLPTSITAVVYRACDRADMPRLGAHRLRHTAATEMRRAGVPLGDIGQVLRHQHDVTTARYAKDDPESLRIVAAPWPGGAA